MGTAKSPEGWMDQVIMDVPLLPGQLLFLPAWTSDPWDGCLILAGLLSGTGWAWGVGSLFIQ